MTAPQSPASSFPSSMARPFAAAPDASRYFPASAIEEARQRIARSIQRGEGPVLAIGATGLGKTMLLEVVAQQFRDQLRPVTLMGGQLCTRRALLQMMLFQLDLPYKEMDESELRLALLAYLQSGGTDPRQILLLVDEADALPPRLLEELRALTNLSCGGQLLVHLVLAGNSTLEEQFADPELELFSQRVSARCYLSAFGREETFQYVRAQVAAVGADPQALFTDDGLEAIFAATDGVPRLVNQLGDQLLWMVTETGYAPLDGQIVQQAWSEQQQLPAPWNTEANENLGVAVEFGELPSEESELEALNIEEDSVFEESTFEDTGVIEEAGSYEDAAENSYAIDFDEDMPASIPLHTAQQFQQEEEAIDLTEGLTEEAAGEETPIIDLCDPETIDVTEQLLVQLHEMDATNVVTDSTANHSTANLDAAAKNPFSEEFDSEEIVLDRYSAFESLLLAEAPRVANCSDTTFAQQLQQLETIEIATVAPLSKLSAEADFMRDSIAGSTEDIEETILDEEPSDVLIIEENAVPQAAVVEGQKFRQLFSSLESASGEPCFG